MWPILLAITITMIQPTEQVQARGGEQKNREQLSVELSIVNEVIESCKTRSSKYPDELESKLIKSKVCKLKSADGLRDLARLFDFLWREHITESPFLANRLEYGFWAAAEELAKRNSPTYVARLHELAGLRDGAGSLRIQDLIKVQKGIKTYEYYVNGKSSQ